METSNSRIITIVAHENAENMNGKRSFEERVFARFDALDSPMQNTDSRPQNLGVRAHDTKAIWEQALKGIVETRRELFKRLDRIYAMALQNRADLRDVEDRLDQIEP